MKKYVKASYDYDTMLSTILQILDEQQYDFYGLRADTNHYSVGDICEPSHQWWQDDPEDGSPYIEDFGFWDGGELDGTCAVEINYYIPNREKVISSIRKAIRRVFESYRYSYSGDADILLLGGDVASGGNDVDEIIIRDAVVLYKF